MSFEITFDYRFDTIGFFAAPQRRTALEAAAGEWEAVIGDEFNDVPAGVSFSVTNPETQSATLGMVLTDPIDDLIIFVGSQSLQGETLAFGGPSGFSALGDAFQSRVSNNFRGSGPVSDFEPWAGAVTFDRDANWNFSLAGPVSDQDDFLSVAVHEIGHVLGIGTSAAFDVLVSDGSFRGANAMALNGGAPVPLDNDGGHIDDGFDKGNAALSPTLATGTRKLLSETDKAILADIGYEVEGYIAQGSQPTIATSQAEAIFGSVVDDFIDGLAGDDQILGSFGRDTLNGGNGDDSLWGENNDDTLFGDRGDDLLFGGSGNDYLDGGAGNDIAVFSGGQTSYTMALSRTGTMVTDRRADGEGSDDLFNIELLGFDTELFDGPFDLRAFGGSAALDQADLESFIELYIAYFNRAPDAIGLNFWGTAFATGTTLEEMATLFGPQDETLATYPPGTTNETFAVSVYNNVLGRTPDQAGIDFWVGQLDQGNVSRDQFILNVLQGAKSDLKPELGQDFVDQQLADRGYLENKIYVGAYFAVHKGMSDVDNAVAAMALFDGTQSSIESAVSAIDGFHGTALDPENGEFLMPLIGVLDDPSSIV